MSHGRARSIVPVVCLASVLAAGVVAGGCSSNDSPQLAKTADNSAADSALNALSDANIISEAGPCACAPVDARPTQRLDLTKVEDNVLAFAKVRGSLDPNQEVVFYWSGTIYPFRPYALGDLAPAGIKFDAPLLKFEGYNIARFVPQSAGGYKMISREMTVYEDPATADILECWTNPLTTPAKSVSVVPVWNDPVNFDMGTKTSYAELTDRVVVWNSDQVLAYPSALGGNAAYEAYSASDVYQGAEMFNFYTNRADLESTNLKTVPALISWTRVGQYLPWMQMGAQAGNIIYHARGRKLPNGYADLPGKIRAYVEARQPQYQHAPDPLPPDASYPRNVTSWRYFKTLKDSSQYSDTCS